MDKKAVDSARKEYDRAAECVSIISTSPDFASVESAWSAFLVANGRVFAKLKQGSKSSSKSRAWWGRKVCQRRNAFINSSLVQLQAAARLPFGGISETAVNAALAMIEAAAPKDEIEGALAVQMACTHTAAMAVLAGLGGGHGSELRVAALGSAAARLLRAYATQVEVLRRLRHGGQQYVRVEHVYVNDGGQAVIGNVKQPEM
jgi:hypothetical protein